MADSQPYLETGNEAERKSCSIEVSVVTPSFNMLDQLRRCCASVADQEGVNYEHIVMDGGSTDGSAEFLRNSPSLVGESKRDKGMYDAINNGFRIARGGVISHLNCDEQYLPGTLQFVSSYFRQHPQVDVLCGDVLTVRPNGALIAYRKTYRPVEPVILASPLHVFTAAMFMRRRIVDEGHLHDDSYKDVGDADFVLRLLRAGYRFAHVSRYLATFTITGYNRSNHVTTIPEEIRRLRARSPWWVKRFRPAWRSVGWGLKLAAGAYSEKMPICYAIYAGADVAVRTSFTAQTASFRWSY
jgi:glycosyltransferase involved in cell wall biosynthesis